MVLTGTFSNGSTGTLPISSTVAAFSSSNPIVANISATGLVSSSELGCGANTTGTAQYTFNGQTVTSPVFSINSFCFEVFPSLLLRNLRAQGQVTDIVSPIAAGETYSGGYIASFVNGSGLGVKALSGTNFTYALVAPVTGVTVSSTGVITAASTVPLATTFVVRATYVVDGSTITDDVNWIVSDEGMLEEQ